MSDLSFSVAVAIHDWPKVGTRPARVCPTRRLTWWMTAARRCRAGRFRRVLRFTEPRSSSGCQLCLEAALARQNPPTKARRRRAQDENLRFVDLPVPAREIAVEAVVGIQ